MNILVGPYYYTKGLTGWDVCWRSVSGCQTQVVDSGLTKRTAVSIVRKLNRK